MQRANHHVNIQRRYNWNIPGRVFDAVAREFAAPPQVNNLPERPGFPNQPQPQPQEHQNNDNVDNNILQNQHPVNYVENPVLQHQINEDPNFAGAYIRLTEDNRRLDNVLNINEERCYAHLSYMTRGKSFDQHFKSYCYATMRMYFDECKLYDTHERLRLSDICFQRLVNSIPYQYSHITPENIDYIRHYNNQQNGILEYRPKWWPFTIKRVSLNDSGNATGPLPLPTSFNPYHKLLMSLGIMITGLTASYLISRALQTQLAGTTIQAPAKQFEQLISIATTLDGLTNTTQTVSKASTNIFGNLYSKPGLRLRR